MPNGKLGRFLPPKAAKQWDEEIWWRLGQSQLGAGASEMLRACLHIPLRNSVVWFGSQFSFPITYLLQQSLKSASPSKQSKKRGTPKERK